MTLTFDSLFSGIGGFDLAFERADMRCVRQVEIDSRCRQVLAHHWPNVRRVNDVKEATGLSAVDLACGGFPCQDLSVAGRREGLDGERSGLWFEFLRIIDESKPQWVVIENVPGLLSSYSGDKPPDDLQPGRKWQTTEESDLAVIFQGLAKCGYWWAYRVLDAQYWRVPQRRRRVFIVASLGDWRGPVKVLFESESSPWDIAPGRETRARTAGTLAPGAHPGGLNGRDIESGNVVYVADVAPALKAKHPSGGAPGKAPAGEFVAYQCQGSNIGPIGTLRKGNGDVTGGIPFVAQPLAAHHGRNCGEDTFIPAAFDTTQITSPENRSNPKPGDPCHTLNSNAHPPMLAFNWQSGGDVRLNISDKHTSALQKSQVPAVQERWGVRRFTPLECERLMGFPDRWSAVDGMSDGARYKMLGNSVAIPVVQWIGERIMQVHLERGKTK